MRYLKRVLIFVAAVHEVIPKERVPPTAHTLRSVHLPPEERQRAIGQRQVQGSEHAVTTTCLHTLLQQFLK